MWAAMCAHIQDFLLTSTIWGVYFSHENLFHEQPNLPFSAFLIPSATCKAMWENHTNGVHTCPSTSEFCRKPTCIYSICQIWTISFCSKVMGELDLAKGMHCVVTTILVCHSPSACMHSQVKECKQCSSAAATVATLLKAGASIIHPHMHPHTPMHVWRNTSTPI